MTSLAVKGIYLLLAFKKELTETNVALTFGED